MSSVVVKEGTILAVAVGSDRDFEMLNKQTEINVQRHYEKAENEMEAAVNAADESIRQEFEEVLKGKVVQTFVTCLEKNRNVSAQNLDSGTDVERLKSQVGWIKLAIKKKKRSPLQINGWDNLPKSVKILKRLFAM